MHEGHFRQINQRLARLRNVFSDPLLRFELSLVTMVLLMLGGTLMYMVLEGWNFFDALYMTVITIATVGYGEVRELSDMGRLFTIFLIFMGVGAATTAISNAVSLALGPVLWHSINRRRMLTRIGTMRDHYIVCGYGRMGRQIIKDLEARKEPFVLIDMKFNEEEMRDTGIMYVEGDATRDEVLQQAGIDHAKGVVTALNTDAANVMTVLTARGLNPKIFIVARVIYSESENKLRRAGANEVINPYQIGGHRMALSLLRPAVHDFLHRLFHFGDTENIDIGQLVVHPGSRLEGQTVGGCDLRGLYGVNILGIRDQMHKLSINPSPTTLINTHDTLIIIGHPDEIYKLERQNLEEDAI
ncbi:MAG: potassium channel family protein [Aggregatilineales bacterium]